MFKQTAALVILGVSLLTTGCSDSDDGLAPTGPVALRAGTSTTFASIQPSVVSGRPTGLGGCPQVQPLRALLNLNVRADDVDLLLREIRLQFFDTGGLAAPTVTLPAPVMTTQFGTALVQARSARSFALDFGFGCGTGRLGTIVVVVLAQDGRGRDHSSKLQVQVH